MSSLLLTFVLFAAITVWGSLFVKLLYLKVSSLEQLGLGYLIGLGLFTYFLFLGSLIGITINLNFVWFSVVCLIIITILLLKLRRIELFAQFNLDIKHSKYAEKSIVLLTVLLFLASLISNLYWPIKDWDSLVLYDFRAKVFAETGSLALLKTSSSFVGYPLLTSLSHALVYLNHFYSPLFIYSLFYGSFLLVFYAILRKKQTNLIALFFTFLLAIAPEMFNHSLMAYTNLPYTVYLVLGAIYLYFWFKDPKWSYIVISALLTGLCTWVRTTEPFWLVNLGLLALFFIVSLVKKSGFFDSIVDWIPLERYRKYPFKKVLLSVILYILLFFSIQSPWRIYASLNGNNAPANPILVVGDGIQTILTVHKVIIFNKVLEYIYKFVLLPDWWLFLLLFLGILYGLVMRRNLLFGFVVLSFMALLVIGAYEFALGYAGWEEIHGSLSRMSIFFGPLIIYFLATLLEKPIRKIAGK